MKKKYTNEDLFKLSKEFIKELDALHDKWQDKRCFPSLSIPTIAINFFLNQLTTGLSISTFCSLSDEERKEIGKFYSNSFFMPTEEDLDS